MAVLGLQLLLPPCCCSPRPFPASLALSPYVYYSSRSQEGKHRSPAWADRDLGENTLELERSSETELAACIWSGEYGPSLEALGSQEDC